MNVHFCAKHGQPRKNPFLVNTQVPDAEPCTTINCETALSLALLAASTPLSALAYSNGGHLFAAVMGRLVQVFESRATREAGRAGLLHALRGHAGNVRGLAWAPDDQRLPPDNVFPDTPR